MSVRVDASGTSARIGCTAGAAFFAVLAIIVVGQVISWRLDFVNDCVHGGVLQSVEVPESVQHFPEFSWFPFGYSCVVSAKVNGAWVEDVVAPGWGATALMAVLIAGILAAAVRSIARMEQRLVAFPRQHRRDELRVLRNRPRSAVIWTVALATAFACVPATLLPTIESRMIWDCDPLEPSEEIGLAWKTWFQCVVIAGLLLGQVGARARIDAEAIARALKFLAVIALILGVCGGLLFWFVSQMAIDVQEYYGGGDAECPADWRRLPIVTTHWATPAYALVFDSIISRFRLRSGKRMMLPWAGFASLAVQVTSAIMLIHR